MKRKNEADNNVAMSIRSERLFMKKNYWYFRTREGMSIGPFDSVKEANDGVNEFMDFIDTTEPKIIERITEYVTQVA